MKVFILACLVALTLARENEEVFVSTEFVENFSSNEQKLENVEHQEQQRKEECQDKTHPVFQSQLLVNPYVVPMPYTVLSQNILPLGQSAVRLSFPQSQAMEFPEVEEILFPKHQVMSFLNSPVKPLLDPQSLNLTDTENQHLPLSLLQLLRNQIPQPLIQTPVFPPLSLLSVLQPKLLPIPQQVAAYPQRLRTLQNFLLYRGLLDQARELYPVTQSLAPEYKPIVVSSVSLTLLFHS
ncbi:PREDICTED: beta-casein [Chrysochloris asiatica]|uniref:Beta-casein n=1 Tax=Chrysochloris asiatica TaxID=185453 RepID=A0A9B0U5G3_CHRAS|nr:PREDICTED: beta-casein [Chrysochloris asiatica]